MASLAGKKLTYIVAVALVMAWFLLNTYMCYQENKMYSDEMSASYARFHTWSTPYLKRTFGASPLPSPDLMKAWKSKVALLLGYLYGILSLCLLAG